MSPSPPAALVSALEAIPSVELSVRDPVGPVNCEDRRATEGANSNVVHSSAALRRQTVGKANLI